MKRIVYFFAAFAFMAILISGGCKKSGGGGGTPAEQNLSVELSPSAGSSQAPSPGPDFPLTVTIKSTMPAAGVKIDVVVKDGATTTFSTSVNSSSAANNFTITNSPRNVTLTVTVTVTSLSKASNVWSGTYTFSRK